MPTRILATTFDCHDPLLVARFWAAALSYSVEPRSAAEVAINDPSGVGPELYFMPVPEPKTVKNRVHVDLASETPLEEEVARLVDAGAVAVETRRDPEGFEDPHIWTVMQDPEGNEFCVVEPLSRRQEQRPE